MLLICSIFEIPPFEVLTIVPKSPTAQPVKEFTKYIERNELDVPLDWSDQLVPPFEVYIIVPIQPAAHPVETLVKYTDVKAFPRGTGCIVQLLPESVDFNIGGLGTPIPTV